MLGLATAARYLPVLILTPYAGLIADRDDKRHVLLATQTLLGVVSLCLGVTVLLGVVRLWMVFVVAVAFGVLTALDNPTRMAFVPEMVGQELIQGAITLNSTMVNVGRAVGPVVAAELVSSVGIGWCFIANGASFAAVLVALLMLDASRLHPSSRPARGPHQLRQGLSYARADPAILGQLCMMVLIGTFAYEFEVSLPLLARNSLAGTTTTYSWLIGAFGAGSVIGGIWAIRHPNIRPWRLIGSTLAFGLAMAGTAAAPTVAVAITLLVIVGFASITFLTTGNSMVQLHANPRYRGRVVALWSTAFISSTPIGAILIGAIGDAAPRAAIAVGAAACLTATTAGLRMLHATESTPTRSR